MNMGLAFGRDNKAMLVYDQPLGFVPAWIESAADGRGVRIIGEEGQEYVAGLPDISVIHQIQHLGEVIMVRMENHAPMESFSVSFVNQSYAENA